MTRLDELCNRLQRQYLEPSAAALPLNSIIEALRLALERINSNFRENFMKSSPTSIKLNHSPLLSGVESEKPMIIEESKEKNEVSSEEYPNKPKGFIRALTEWFK